MKAIWHFVFDLNQRYSGAWCCVVDHRFQKIPIDCAEWNGSQQTLQLNCLSEGKSMARFELVRWNCWSLVKISSGDFVGMMVMITFDV